MEKKKIIAIVIIVILFILATVGCKKEGDGIFWQKIIITEANNGLQKSDTIKSIHKLDTFYIWLNNYKNKNYEYQQPEYNSYYDTSNVTLLSRSYITKDGDETSDENAPLYQYKYKVNKGGRSHISIKNKYTGKGRDIDYVALSVELVINSLPKPRKKS